jgi:CarboxypepD_reg-like domain
MKPLLSSRLFTSVLLFTVMLLCTYIANAQYKISGTVINNKNKPVKGANVYLENTIDGGTTDSTGVFRFTTSEKGNQTLVASEVSHEAGGTPIVINGDMSGIVITLKANKAHDLDAVVITAGSFDASNDKNKTVLKPLDIVTTAGAGADVVKAMEMLPGTQKTGTDNGMFVRGGDASEAAIVVDEMVIQNAFLSGPPGVSTRSRFGAFNYQGVSFSSGGYSARYGQALSSVLELNTTDLADKSTINLGVNMAGLYASGVKRWKNSSLDVGGNYTNTAPFFALADPNVKFYNPPQGGSGNLRYTWKPSKNGILKVSLNANFNSSGIEIPNPFEGDTSSANITKDTAATIKYGTNDQYYYSNISYRQFFKAKYMLYTAASYSLDKTDNKFGTLGIAQEDHRMQYRLEGKDYITGRFNVLLGTDVQSYGISKTFEKYTTSEFTETLVSGYTELEWTPINMLAIRPGVRYEHSTLLDKSYVVPRLSLAVKTGDHSQVSLAGGMFYQNADNNYLLYGYKPDMQRAIHYIANWQYSKNDRLLRLEAYSKKYENLILENSATGYDPNQYRTYFSNPGNNGFGYAHGIELFWRDKKTFKNVDYWITYSYIDTKRKNGNYLFEATPTFVSDHNLNLVGKYFVDKWKTNFSVTYSYASGRPYYDPNYNPATESNFLSGRTPDYHNLAIAVAYLHTFGKWFTVFYVSFDNVTDNHNVFGYRYTKNSAGTYDKKDITPALYRSIFFGVNMSLTQFSKDEL